MILESKHFDMWSKGRSTVPEVQESVIPLWLNILTFEKGDIYKKLPPSSSHIPLSFLCKKTMSPIIATTERETIASPITQGAFQLE